MTFYDEPLHQLLSSMHKYPQNTPTIILQENRLMSKVKVRIFSLHKKRFSTCSNTNGYEKLNVFDIFISFLLTPSRRSQKVVLYLLRSHHYKQLGNSFPKVYTDLRQRTKQWNRQLCCMKNNTNEIFKLIQVDSTQQTEPREKFNTKHGIQKSLVCSVAWKWMLWNCILL